MTTYTVVRFRPKPDMREDFINTYTSIERNFDGLTKAALVKVSEDEYFAIAEWVSEDHLIAARPVMAGNLRKFRHTLDFMGAEPNVTEAFSGHAIHEIPEKKKPA